MENIQEKCITNYEAQKVVRRQLGNEPRYLDC